MKILPLVCCVFVVWQGRLQALLISMFASQIQDDKRCIPTPNALQLYSILRSLMLRLAKNLVAIVLRCPGLHYVSKPNNWTEEPSG